MRKLNTTIHVLLILTVVCFSTTAQAQQNKPNGSSKVAETSTQPTISIDGFDKVSYVRSFDFYKALTSDVTLSSEISSGNILQTTQYVDGLGRPIQTVARRALPGNKDMVQFSVYDEYGRVIYQPLPFQSNYDDGRLHLTPSSQQSSFLNGHYTDEDIFYGLTEFENSPLNRVTKQMAPGNSWAGSGVGVASDWRTNSAGDAVRIWTSATTPSSSNTYSVGELMVSITTDEESNKMKEFTDKLGRVILKQVQKGSGSSDVHADWLNTYYIYDDHGNLSHVLPPRAVELLNDASWSWNSTDMDGLVFKYTYDYRNRMITKKVPGAGITEMVYDKFDRLVASRDAEMEDNGKWLITKYDAYNRPILTGIYTNSSSRASLQATVNGWVEDLNVRKEITNPVGLVEGLNITVSSYVTGTTTYQVKQGGTIEFLQGFDSGSAEFETKEVISLNYTYSFYQGYYDASFPVIDGALEVLSLSYFDDYEFTTQTYDLGYNDFYGAGGSYNAITPSQYADVSGLPTGSKVKVLGSTDEWLTTVMFYDDRGRVIQTQADNHVGGRDISTTQYDFSGKVLNTYTVHNNPNATPSTTTIAKRYTYDGSGTGRLLTVQEKLNNTGSHKIIATNTYNGLGELESKTLGNSLETLNYDYNIRGWLEGINEDYVASGTGGHYFGMDLSYDYGFTNNQLNGNIAGVKWRSASHSDQRAYGFDYDKVNRLTKADYSQGSGWVNTINDFSTTYGYDANGNILNLMREGVVAGSIQTIDNLTYTYLNGGKSNQLVQVADAAGDLGQGDFVDGNTGTDYAYDSNGNMTQDLNKDINGGDITYNHLNLPERIEFSNNANKTISYTYDATGIKLKKTVNNNGSITTTDYVSGFIYDNNQLQHFSNEEGRVRKNYQGNLVYDYFVKDHLGNTRMTLTEEIKVTPYRATMETSLSVEEDSLFLNVSSTSKVSTAANVTGGGDRAARLNGSVESERLGPAKMLQVMAGDEIDIEVYAYYVGQPSSHTSVANVAFATLIGNVFGGSATGTKYEQRIQGLFDNNLPQVVRSTGSGENTDVKAYLNYIIFNKDFTMIDEGFRRVDQVSADGNGRRLLQLNNIDIEQSGFVYVYVSNEGDVNFQVFFDELLITHAHGPILQEDHYYPFGMNINALSSTAPLSKPNQFKYGGQEFANDFDLGWYQYRFRNYDPAISRFFNLDPLTDKFYYNSPYAFAENKLGLGIEFEGLELMQQRGTAGGEKNGKIIHAADRGIRVNPQVAAAMIAPRPQATIGPKRMNLFSALRAINKGSIHGSPMGRALVDGAFQAANDASITLSKTANDLKLSDTPAHDLEGNLATPDEVQNAGVNNLTAFFTAGAGKAMTMTRFGSMNPNKIRFSQNSVKSGFKDGTGSIDDLTRGLLDGSISAKDVPAVRVVMRDGKLYTLDNRRLEAFKNAGKNITYELIDYDPEKHARYFTTKNDGESVRVRGNNN